MRPVLIIAALVAVLYAAYAALMIRVHPQFIYPFASTPFQSSAFEQVTLDDGVIVFVNDAPTDAPVIVYFMGNAGALQLFKPMLDFHSNAGRKVVAMGYRGGGGLAGTPSEQQIKSDALIVMSALPDLVGERPVIVQGISMGTGVALHAAAYSETPVDSVILTAPYRRICELMAQASYLPACYLPGVQRWDNLALVPHIKASVLIFHGGQDTLIPPDHSEALYANFKSSGVDSTLHIIEGASHTDLFKFSSYFKSIEAYAGRF